MNRWVWVVRQKARWRRNEKYPATGGRLMMYMIPAFDTLRQAARHGYARKDLVKVDVINWACGEGLGL